MNLRSLFAGSALVAVVAVTTQPGCEASLDSECVGGDGTCDLHDATTSSSSTSAGSGGGGVGGGEGGGPTCYEGCDTESLSGNTGEFPCDVQVIMEDNCQRCHTDPPVNGAPFPLDSYEDSQQLYNGTAIWARMHFQVVNDLMPQAPPLLDTLEKRHLLDDWACQCAPPRDAGDTCN